MPTRNATDADPTLSRAGAWLFAIAGGLAVASVYYAQPLLDLMAADFGIPAAALGLVVTVTQIGYGAGLLLLVPLGDLWNRRRLIVGQSVLSALALAAVGFATSGTVLLIAMTVVGVLAVVTQSLVAYAAALAAPADRGRIVGIVTSGVVVGIVLARTAAGALAQTAGWRAIYFVSAVSTLLVAIALHRALPVRDAGKSAASYLQLLQSVFALFVQVPVLRVRAAIALLMFAGFSALWTAMVLPFSAPPHSLSHGVIGLFGLAGAAGALAAARAGRWADRGFGQRTTGAGLALMLLAWWPMHRIDDALWPFVIGLVLFNLALQAVHVTNQSLIFVARPDARSRLVAGYMIFYSLGSALGAIASTALYARVGWSGVCGLGATASALALAVWLPTLWRGSASGPDETRAVTRAAA